MLHIKIGLVFASIHFKCSRTLWRVFRDSLSVHSELSTHRMSKRTQHFSVTVWHAAVTVTLSVEEVRKQTRSSIPVHHSVLWHHCCVICSCFPASLSEQQGASHSFPPTRNTHAQLTSYWQKRNLCFYGSTEAPFGKKNGAVFSVPVWLIPNCIWQTQ